MGGAFVISLIMVIFWMPETAFHRSKITLNTVTAGEVRIDVYCSSTSHFSIPARHVKDLADKRSIFKGATEGEKSTKTEHAETPVEANSGRSPPQSKSSWWKTYRPYSGYVSDVPLLTTLFRPFLMLLSPVVLWATLSFMTGISWLVGISITMSQIFSASPYNFSVGAVGASNLSSFVASVIGMAVARPLIDSTVRQLSRRNKGIFGISLLPYHEVTQRSTMLTML
jgi:hypothetical protein